MNLSPKLTKLLSLSFMTVGLFFSNLTAGDDLLQEPSRKSVVNRSSISMLTKALLTSAIIGSSEALKPVNAHSVITSQNSNKLLQPNELSTNHRSSLLFSNSLNNNNEKSLEKTDFFKNTFDPLTPLKDIALVATGAIGLATCITYFTGDSNLGLASTAIAAGLLASKGLASNFVSTFSVYSIEVAAVLGSIGVAIGGASLAYIGIKSTAEYWAPAVLMAGSLYAAYLFSRLTIDGVKSLSKN